VVAQIPVVLDDGSAIAQREPPRVRHSYRLPRLRLESGRN
jgi:hypothetical protein